MGLVAAAGTVIGAAFFTSRKSPPSPLPARERILVAPLENRTGDSRIDPLGEMAADWIAQGLQETGLVEVINPLTAVISRRRVEGQSLGTGLARAGALAQSAGAGSVLWGAVYRLGDSLVFRAQVSDVATGTMRVALEPVAANAADPRDGVERLRMQVAGALAAQLDRRVSSVTDATAKPPTLEAYREYALGLEEFQHEEAGGRDAIPHFAAASRIDTTFYAPLVWLVFGYGNRGQQKQSDSIIAILAAHRERLAPLDRYALDVFEAKARQDWNGQLKAELEAARLSPGSEWSYNAGLDLLDRARPREALGYLRQVDAENGWAREWSSYWANLTQAQHWLGEYREELAAAERFRAVSPESRAARAIEARAMIGLGRSVEVEAQARALLAASPPSTESPIVGLNLLADEFAAHGYPAAARRLFELIVDWPASPRGQAWAEGRSPDDATSRSLRSTVALALYGLGRWSEARIMFDQLLVSDSTNIGLRFRATLAAVRDGDQMAAEDFTRSLSVAETRGFLGADYLRAQLALVMGDTVAVLRHLRSAASISRGVRYRFNIHRESDWQTVRDDPRFQVLIRPPDR